MASIFKNSKIKEKLEKFEIKDLDKKIEIVKKWHNDYHSGTLKQDKETSREQSFNQDFFISILEYKQKPETPYTIEPKATTEKGQLPDVVLGYFDEENKHVSAVIELKSAKIPLDRPQQREGNLSPIQQAFKYKSQYYECPFVIVSNFYEFRLFQDNQLDYEIWTLNDLIDSSDNYYKFRKFYLLLCADNFISKSGKSKTEELLTDIRIEEEEISKKFYKEYHSLRVDLLRDIWKRNELVRKDIEFGIEKAQKIIDRIVFVCFCEDKGLLPDNTLQRMLKSSESGYGSCWNNLKGLFEGIDKGNDKLEIPSGYNGGLFKNDNELNNLELDDDIVHKLAGLGKFNFREDLSVNILGHIFEQSISDLEEIKNKTKDENKVEMSGSIGKRKQDGIFYTPNYIVTYIIQNSLGKYLQDKEEELKIKHNLKEDIQDKNYEKREKIVYLEYQKFLQNIKVIDPACGSGAFLVKVFDYLLEENKRIGDILGGLFANEDYYKSILKNNIFGVDLNSESVEITKLSLWLKTAQKGKKLTDLDDNIKCGNSLIDNPNADKNKAFDWNKEFSEIMNNGGFDIVVMNPPYVDSESMTQNIPEQRAYLQKNFKTTTGNWDLYIPFIEQSFNIISKNGLFAVITPDKWLSKDFGYTLRKTLLPNITSILTAGREVFTDAKVDSIVTVFSKKPSNQIEILETSEPGLIKNIRKVSKETLSEPFSLDYLFAQHLEILKEIEKFKNKVSDIAECENACATSDAYKLKDLIFESEYLEDDEMGIINTGTIDKYVSRWGKLPMTYLGNKYLNPALNKEKFKTLFGNSYYRRALKSKLIIKGLTLLHACIDIDAKFVPGKSTLVITNENIDVLKLLLVYINSSLPSFYIKNKYISASYNGGISFTKDMLNELPIPPLSEEEKDQLISLSNKLINLSNDFISVRTRFFNRIKDNFDLKNIPKSLEKFHQLEFAEILKQLKKQRSIPLNEQDDIESYYNSCKKEASTISKQIIEAESIINNIFLGKYGFSDNIKKIITSKS